MPKQRPFRRKRGVPTVAIHVEIATDAKARLDALANAFNVPQWAVVEAALQSGEVGENGWPVGWDLPATDDEPSGEELPIERP